MAETELFDAVVVGGGLAGTAAAAILGQAGLRTMHLAPKAPPDRRTSALMLPSVDFLTDTHLIGAPEAIGNRLAAIRIIDATPRLLRAPEAHFQAREGGLDAFGWNFPNIVLLEKFESARDASRLVEIEPAALSTLTANSTGWHLTLASGREIRALLVVGADGKGSLVRRSASFTTREHRFTQAALVGDLMLGRPLGETSVEFHYPNGPFTLVPAGGNKANLVWIDQEDVLRNAQTEGPDGLTARFRDKSQRLFGSIELSTATHVFPLSTLSVATAGQSGVVLVGEAAHAFPPIGAQGLNLALRDVADLATALEQRDRSGDWASAVSRDYARRRAPDLARTGTMVDALFRSLLAEMLPAQAVRAGGLWALKLVPGLRRSAFSLGMGGK
jgi:2-octaprenyl-6-methoxyphenol hydroxylase